MQKRKRGLNYKVLTLDNGVILYVLPMSWVKTLGLGVHVNVGTRDEFWPKEAGLAHAIEHMNFQGTEEFADSKAVAEHLETVGGMNEAYTGQEMTFFYNCLPTEERERGFKILSQQLCKSLFLPDNIETEMKNVVHEIHRANDNPFRFLAYKFAEVLYGEHPLAKRILGLEESVSSFKREYFLSWRERFYHSSNFTFVAVGNISPKEARDYFEAYFPEKSSLPANERVRQSISRVPKDLTLEKKTEQAYVILGGAVSGAGERDSVVLKVFNIMLDGGMSFPLFQEIRDKRGLCYEIGADFDSWSDVGTFMIYLGTRPQRIIEAEDAIFEVIHHSKNSQPLLEKAKQLMRGRSAFSFESPGQIISSAGMELTFNKKLRGYDETLREVESVSIEEVEDVVTRHLDSDKIIKAVLLPKSVH